jgi:hypothetical protein
VLDSVRFVLAWMIRFFKKMIAVFIIFLRKNHVFGSLGRFCFPWMIRPFIFILIVLILKPGPARWVDLGPGQPGPGTSPDLSKNSREELAR